MRDDLAGRRVASYARYSTDKQSESSIDDQHAKLARFVEARAGKIARRFDDAATSGAIRSRPGVDALLAAALGREIDVLVIEDTSRLTRDSEDWSYFEKRFSFYGVRVLAIDDAYDSASESAQFIGAVQSANKAQQRRETAVKTLRGLEERARAGFASGGVAFGYRTVRVPYKGGEASQIAIDDVAAAIVRDIFERYALGSSYREIVCDLNARGIAPPRASKARREQRWGLSTVRSILQNAAYSGAWSFGRRKWLRDPETRKRVPRDREEPILTQHRPELAIVDPDTYARVRARLDGVRTLFTGRRTVPIGATHRYPLSGILACEHCGKPLQIHGGGAGGRRYYRCSGVVAGTCALGVRSLRESAAREQILGAIRERFGSVAGRALLAELVAAEQSGEDETTAARSVVARRIESNEGKARRLADAIADGSAPAAVLDAIRLIEAQVRADREALARLSAPAAAPMPDVTPDELLEALGAELDGEPGQVREALRRLLDGGTVRVRVESDGVYARGGLLPGMIFARSVACIAGARSDDFRRPGGDDLVVWVDFAA